MLTFQTENWSDLERDGSELFKVHYDELALHKEVMPMGLDGSIYLELERLKRLLVVTVRRDGELVGYYLAIFIPKHPHNKDAAPVSTTDMFYVHPDHRRGGTGAKLLMFVAQELKKLGIGVASLSIKWQREEDLDWSTMKMLIALGWEPTDLVFQLVLREGQG